MKIPTTAEEIAALSPEDALALSQLAIQLTTYEVKQDPEDPRVRVTTIRELNVGNHPGRYNTGPNAAVCLLHFCLATLEGMGILPPEFIDQMMPRLPPKPESEAKATSNLIILPR